MCAYMRALAYYMYVHYQPTNQPTAAASVNDATCELFANNCTITQNHSLSHQNPNVKFINI